MLGTAPHRLHRRPHITIPRNQVPTRRLEIAGLDLPARIYGFRSAIAAVRQHPRPSQITIALHDCVRATEFHRLLGKKSRVDSPEDHKCAPLPRHLPDFVAPQRIRSMNPNPYRVAFFYALRFYLKQSFIHQNRIAKRFRRSGSQHILPARSDYRGSKRHTARVNQMNVHARSSFLRTGLTSNTLASRLVSAQGTSSASFHSL